MKSQIEINADIFRYRLERSYYKPPQKPTFRRRKPKSDYDKICEQHEHELRMNELRRPKTR